MQQSTILAGVATAFPRYLWDLLLPQTKLTLNLLHQSTANPTMLAWEFFSGPFNYDVTPLGPLRICVISHDKPLTQKWWGFRGNDGWSVVVLLEHYRCQQFIPNDL